MVNMAQSDSSLNFTVSAVELYFNDCNDLLNNKAKIPIAGQSSVKSQSFRQTEMTGGLNAQFDEKGKWVPPKLTTKDHKVEYEAKGAKEVDLQSEKDVI